MEQLAQQTNSLQWVDDSPWVDDNPVKNQTDQESEPQAVQRNTEPSGISINFPFDAVSGFIKEYADTYSKYFESPYEFWVFNVAVYLGSLIVGRVRLETSLKTEPRLYVACIGESGVTRKSEAARQTYSFFEELIRVGKIGVCQGVGSANGLARFLKEHPCGILQIDEMRTIMQKTDIKGSVLLETLTSLFDGNYYSNYTKDEAMSIKDASLSFIGCTTIKVWEDMFNAPSVGTGLVNRFWIVPGQTDKVIVRPNIPEEETSKLMDKLTKIQQIFPDDQTTTLHMENDAEELWNKWYLEYRTTKTDSDTATRLDTYGDRLMMILCVSEGKTTIDADLVKRVISLLEWQKNVRVLHQPKDFDNTIAKVEDKVRKAGMEKKGWKYSELYSKLHIERYGLSYFRQSLKNLEIAGVLTVGSEKAKKIHFS